MPAFLTSFIGREPELDELLDRLPRTRLLTLTGVGGSGKTRLATEVARRVGVGYASGIRLVELATIADPTLVAQAVAARLGIREVPGQPLIDALLAALREQQVLLLLDNCEHVLDATARLADTLLRGCPRLTIVATSREPLALSGEVLHHVRVLAFPPLVPLPPVHDLVEYPAVRLFVERARAFSPAFDVGERNARSIAEICHRLDGMPLALELAAALVRGLSVDEIAARLDHRFGLLSAGSRSGLPRQQTLRATIDWSFQLLTPAEQSLFARLSVFVGLWDLEAVDKSLVLADADQHEHTHYRMLDTLREYGRDRLLATGQSETVGHAHAVYFLDLVERAELHHTEWLDRLALHESDCVAALDWYAAHADVQAALRLAGVMGQFWQLRGQLADGLRRVTRILELPDAKAPTLARARALEAAGLLTMYLGDLAATRVYLKESLALYRRHEHTSGVAWVLIHLAWVCQDHYRYKAARRLLREALPLCEQISDRRVLARGLNVLGMVENCTGDLERARALHEQSLALCRTIGDRWGTGWAFANLGWDLMMKAFSGTVDDAKESERALQDALEIWEELGERRHIAFALMNLSVTSTLQGKVDAGRTQLAQATAEFSEMHDGVGLQTATTYWLDTLWGVGDVEGYVRLSGTVYTHLAAHRHSPGFIHGVLEEHIDACRERLGPARFDALWAEGCAMSIETAFGELEQVEAWR